MTPSRLVAILVGSLVLILGSAAVTQAEEPEKRGFLVVSPAQGDLSSAIDIATSDVCTRGQVFAVTLDGPNLTRSDRGNVIGATKIATIGPESYPGHYVVPLPTNLATYLATAAPGQRIRGDYTLTFACRDTLSTADLQVFTAVLSIDGKGRYTAKGKAATAMEAMIDGYVPGSVGLGSIDPPSPDPEEVAEYSTEQSAARSDATEAFPLRNVLIIAGILLLLAAAYSWWRGRSKSADADAPEEDASVGAAP